ncbi:MAG: ligase-associated DNA damage response endonuclease PdeM [Pseudomonadota bacterium]
MNPPTGYAFRLGAAHLVALPEKALWWADAGLLVVSDMHLGKAERMARRSGSLVPPYETRETIARLEDLIGRWAPAHVLCLGDSFDDTIAMRALPEEVTLSLTHLMAGRRWTWILGNHDPGPVDMGGTCTRDIAIDGLAFRHIADPAVSTAEVSGHYHPKARIRGARRPAFITDGTRLILPAFGTYTGGLDADDTAISGLMGVHAIAILAGRTMAAVPLNASAPPHPGPPTRWARGLG